MRKVALSGSTIPYQITAEYGGAKVMLRPASPGTGVIAGGGVRAVLEAVGVSDILTKSQGSPNLLNVAMATLEALSQLRSSEELAAMRGKPVNTVRPFWERQKEIKVATKSKEAERVAEVEVDAEPVMAVEEVEPETESAGGEEEGKHG